MCPGGTCHRGHRAARPPRSRPNHSPLRFPPPQMEAARPRPTQGRGPFYQKSLRRSPSVGHRRETWGASWSCCPRGAAAFGVSSFVTQWSANQTSRNSKTSETEPIPHSTPSRHQGARACCQITGSSCTAPFLGDRWRPDFFSRHAGEQLIPIQGGEKNRSLPISNRASCLARHGLRGFLRKRPRGPARRGRLLAQNYTLLLSSLTPRALYWSPVWSRPFEACKLSTT